MSTFAKWLSMFLNEREIDVQRILADPTAHNFLISWSLFESKCFSGFLKAREIRNFARGATHQGFLTSQIREQVSHFHERYRGSKGAKALSNLLHDDKTSADVADDFRRCLSESPDTLSAEKQVFLVAFVVYRYRNNMFHGNKGVQSWLRFKAQIELCTAAMQAFVTHAESVRPTLAVADAA